MSHRLHNLVCGGRQDYFKALYWDNQLYKHFEKGKRI